MILFWPLAALRINWRVSPTFEFKIFNSTRIGPPTRAAEFS
jgi:hypothetical protein